MDESAIWDKIALGEAECYLNCCKCKFFPNCTLVHGITY